MHGTTEAIGMMASLTSFLLWLPQGARVWRNRRDPAQLQGIVLSTQAIALTGTVLWGVYALLIDSFWLGAPSLVNGPIAIATLVIVGRANRATRASRASCSAGVPADDVPAPARPATRPVRVVRLVAA